jgi:hypothetical protein
MCAGVLEALNFSQNHNIMFSQTCNIEGMQDYSAAELKALARDKAFRSIWEGGVLHCHLSIRCQVAEESGRLIYNGRPFNRSQWSWRPPKIIRIQGRLAKEASDPRNNNPEISIYTESGKLLRLDACPCGGELLMDHRGFLYCKKCNTVYE